MNAPVLMKRVVAKVVSNVEVMPGYYLLCAEASHIASNSRPGQFVMVKCGDNLTLRRPLSIHKLGDANQIFFLFAATARMEHVLGACINRQIEIRKGRGEGTSWLSQRQSGDEIDLLGPLGNGFSIEPPTENLLLVAGGVGVAPLMFLADQAIKLRKHVILLLGARGASWVYSPRYLSEKMEVVIVTEAGDMGKKGMVSDIFMEYTDWADQIYACGPLAMYQSMADQMQKQSKRKPVQVSLEVRMGCGVGACYGCSIKTRDGMRQVCKDGPVFDMDKVIWQEVQL